MNNPRRGITPVNPVQLRSGFILADASLNLVCANSEALRILQPKLNLGVPPAKSLRQRLLELCKRFDLRSPFLVDFRSGRRLYVCRSYPLDLVWVPRTTPVTTPRSLIAFLLERSHINGADTTQAARLYRLSQREKVALELLTLGLATKEIAQQMKVSPNTVKAFLRSVMGKTGVSTRMGLIKRIMDHA